MYLHQVIAAVKTAKKAAAESLTNLLKRSGNDSLWNGFTKVYELVKEPSANEIGAPQYERIPDEVKAVQFKYVDEIKKAFVPVATAIDKVLTQETGNRQVEQTLKVDGEVLGTNLPAGALLFIQKQLEDLRTLVSAAPTLDQVKTWKFNDEEGLYVTPQSNRNRSLKMMMPIVKAPATEKHPAQVELVPQDVWVGTYKEVIKSGAISLQDKLAMLERIDKLITGVRDALEEGNRITVESQQIGDKLLGFILRDSRK